MDVSGNDDTRPIANSQKRNTAADQFAKDHEQDSPKKSVDRLELVQRHNQAVPRLYDELEKRRSITKIATIKARNVGKEFDLRCPACARLAALKELKKLQLRPKCKERGNKNRNQSKVHRRRFRKNQSRPNQKPVSDKKKNKLVGVEKNQAIIRGRNTSKSYKLYNFKSKSCQCSTTSNIAKESKCASNCRLTTYTISLPNEPTNAEDNATKYNVLKRRTKLHSNSSVSSYNSYMSLDHEPMDASS